MHFISYIHLEDSKGKFKKLSSQLIESDIKTQFKYLALV